MHLDWAPHGPDSVGSAMRLVRITVLLLSSSLFFTMLSCDPASVPEVCNGFESPVVLTLYAEGQAVKYIDNYSPGECKPLMVLAPVLLTDEYDGESREKKLLSGLTVATPAGRILAHYSLEAAHQLGRGSIGRGPPWVMTVKGVFWVPWEFAKNWRGHIQDIEKTAVRSFPSRYREPQK